MEAVKTENLVKKYGGTTALAGVDLDVRSGELFGLLGVNGAGKTTLIRILSGLTKPTAGEAYVFGRSVRGDLMPVKEFTGVSPQETSVAPNLTVRENLAFFAAIYGADKQERAARVREVTETFKLDEVMDKRAKTLSGGWQRRLSIAAALVSRPRILYLDEPTLGLDVLARRELWRVIEKLKGRVTVVLTSHYLEEIEALCDRVAIMTKGRIAAVGTVAEIKAVTGENNFENAFVRIAEECEKCEGC